MRDANAQIREIWPDVTASHRLYGVVLLFTTYCDLISCVKLWLNSFRSKCNIHSSWFDVFRHFDSIELGIKLETWQMLLQG